MKKIVLNSVMVIVGVAFGFVAGDFLVAMRFFGKPTLTRYAMWTTIAQGVSERAFEENSSDAPQLQRKHLWLLENGMDPSSRLDPSMKKGLLLQAALTKARLSILEKRSGNAEQADSYMSSAQADLKTLGWLDYSAAHVEQTVQPRPAKPVATPSVKPASAQVPAIQTK